MTLRGMRRRVSGSWKMASCELIRNMFKPRPPSRSSPARHFLYRVKISSFTTKAKALKTQLPPEIMTKKGSELPELPCFSWKEGRIPMTTAIKTAHRVDTCSSEYLWFSIHIESKATKIDEQLDTKLFKGPVTWFVQIAPITSPNASPKAASTIKSAGAMAPLDCHMYFNWNHGAAPVFNSSNRMAQKRGT